ncbi:hypothetical protein MHM39_14925 [Phaeobacter sp. CNT1-3]|nr:hypothetical protein [Phaeobacter sp. CNT1-3]
MSVKKIPVAEAPAEWIKSLVVAGLPIEPDGFIEYDDYEGETPVVDLEHGLTARDRDGNSVKGAVCLVYKGGTGYICYVK